MSERKMSKDDPAFIAHVKIVEALSPYTRTEQLRVMAATCIMLGEYDYAYSFIQQLQRDEREAAKKDAGP